MNWYTTGLVIHLFTMRQILILLSLLQANLSFANPLFDGFSADYEVSKNDTVLGVSHRKLIVRDNGTKLDYSSTTVPTGLIAMFVSDRFLERSEMRLNSPDIQTLKYQYQRSGGKKEILFNASFDWQSRQIKLSNRPDPQPLKTNSHDLLSFQIALMQGLSQGIKNFKFHIVDHKRIQLQSLEYSEYRKINTSLGQMDVIQLDHHSDKSHYRFSFLCAKQLDYLPILITKTEQDGDIVRLKLTKFNQKPIYLQGTYK